MKKLIEESGLSLSEFAKAYEIPYNTVRQWYVGDRSAPSYVTGLIKKVNELKKKCSGRQGKIKIATIKKKF